VLEQRFVCFGEPPQHAFYSTNDPRTVNRKPTKNVELFLGSERIPMQRGPHPPNMKVRKDTREKDIPRVNQKKQIGERQ
jgi:hypothetical protein